jgi:CheY-like chemotaxis protein
MATDNPESADAEEIIVDEIYSFREVSPAPSFLCLQSNADWLRIINDLNNQLTIVTGATDTVLAQLKIGLSAEDRNACREHLGNALRAARRVAEVVARLGHITVQPPLATGFNGPQERSLPALRTILLVEDEKQVRLLAKASLVVRGYRVLEALDGKQALAESAQHQGPIHLLVTDFELDKWTTKPVKMTGQQLADHLRPLRPEMKVVYISGLPEQEVRQFIHADDVFVQKPFLTFEQFTAAIDQVLSK